MNPRINLYKESLRPKKDWLGLTQLGINLALVGCVLLGVSVKTWLEERDIAHRVAALRQSIAIKEQLIRRFTETHPIIKKDPQLDLNADLIEKKLNDKKKALNYLNKNKFGNTNGFSDTFRQIARLPYPDMWLTQIEFTHGGKDAVFIGRAIRDDAMFAFIDGLQESRLKNYSFPYFQVSRIKTPGDMDLAVADSTVLRFGLATQLQYLNAAITKDLDRSEQTEAAIKEVEEFQSRKGKTMQAIAETVNKKIK